MIMKTSRTVSAASASSWRLLMSV